MKQMINYGPLIIVLVVGLIILILLPFFIFKAVDNLDTMRLYMHSGERITLEIVYDEHEDIMYGINVEKGLLIPLVDENGHTIVLEEEKQ